MSFGAFQNLERLSTQTEDSSKTRVSLLKTGVHGDWLVVVFA